MNCTDIRTYLGAYLARSTTPLERKAIQGHLATCPECQAELEALSALQRELRASLRAKAAASRPDPQLRSKLERRVKQSWRGGTTRRSYDRLLQTGVAEETCCSGNWLRSRFTSGFKTIFRLAVPLSLLIRRAPRQFVYWLLRRRPSVCIEESTSSGR